MFHNFSVEAAALYESKAIYKKPFYKEPSCVYDHNVANLITAVQIILKA